MKSRLITAVVCGVFWSVTQYFGVVHHHEHDRCPFQEHKDCAACEWQINAVTDVPCAVPLLVGPVLERPLEVFDFTSYTAPSFSFSLSRAPPAASA